MVERDLRRSALLCLALGCLSACDLDAPARAHGEAAAASPTLAEDVFESEEACRAAEATPRPDGSLRLATWNVRWFPQGTADVRRHREATNVVWLACAIAAMDLDVLAVQEFVRTPAGRAETNRLLRLLGERTGGRWEARFDDCREDGRQHLGFLFRADRVALETRVVADVNPNGGPCAGRLRPGLLARVEAQDGRRVHVLNVHLDSGVQARDHGNRARSFEAIARLSSELAREDADASFIALGDFNTMGGPDVEADHERDALDRALARGGRVTQLSSDEGCTEITTRYASVLDYAYGRLAQDARGTSSRVVGPCARSCERSTARRHPFFDELSDHCPVVVDMPMVR